MTTRRLACISGLGIMTVLSGCKSDAPSAPVVPESEIVKQVEAAGSGKLEGLDRATIQGWLAGHQDVAKKIGPECKSVGVNATAAWATTTEGNVCAADAQVLFLTPTQHYKPY